jgi:MoxR-like ATPase
MFEAKALSTIYRQNKTALERLVDLERELNQRFFGMESAIGCMMLAAMTGEAMVMIGPPGTAKSRLVRSFCNLLGILDDEALSATRDEGGKEEIRRGERYFEYLLTQFTEPSELFGYFDLGKLFGADGQRELARKTEGMMQKAEVVFLDEVFNASSAILNSLLTFMNERKFHDRGTVYRTPLRLLFSATNHPPREEGLGAVYDRFLLRCRLENVAGAPGNFANLIDAAWRETHATPHADATRFGTLLGDLDRYRAQVDEMTADGTLAVRKDDRLFARLADMVVDLRRKELSQMSNRRLVKFAGVIMANALLRTARAGGDAPMIEPVDLAVILHYGLDAEDEGAVRKALDHLTGA